MNREVMFLDIAETIAKQSHCVRIQVGAVLVKDTRIISTGYNGTPSSFINCADYFKDSSFYKDSEAGRIPNATPSSEDREAHHKWSTKFEVHAEMNALLYAARVGISTSGCTMYVTHQPCHQCLKNMIAADIYAVVYRHPYDRSDWDVNTESLIYATNFRVRRI